MIIITIICSNNTKTIKKYHISSDNSQAANEHVSQIKVNVSCSFAAIIAGCHINVRASNKHWVKGPE